MQKQKWRSKKRDNVDEDHLEVEALAETVNDTYSVVDIDIGPISDHKRIVAMLVHSPMHIKKELCASVKLQPVQTRIDVTVTEVKGIIDGMAYKLLQDIQLPGALKYPTIITGDGNCLPRCGSLFAYGSEEYHADTRTRIAVELIQHLDCYFDSTFLSRGWPDDRVPHPSALAYAQYSDYFNQGQVGPIQVEEIFNKEVNELLMSSTHMGI
jgi:hypothetical protein